MDADTTVGDLGERALIELIDSVVGKPQGALGIGDDAAVVPVPAENEILATTDSLVEDVHFRVGAGGGTRLGEKAMAVNLSDIAAMGGIPRWTLVSLIAAPATPVAYIRDLYAGLATMARRFGVSIVGGNVSATGGPLVVDVTLLGLAPAGQVVTRSGAQVGDVVAVTGTLGRSAAHRALVERELESERGAPVPEPRVAAGRSLAAARIPHAMLDLSDGVATDIQHLSRASGVGAALYAADIPVDIAARKAGQTLGVRPLDLAIFGGEDYELLIALPEDRVPAAVEACGDVPLAVVGTILPADHGVVLEEVGGRREPLRGGGWEHFRRD